MSFESKDGPGEESLVLDFSGVEVFCCSYMPSCLAKEIHQAYDKVISIPDGDLLNRVKERLGKRNADISDVVHYAIYFDDGP